MRDPDWYFAFVPRALAGGRDPRATAAVLAKTLFIQPRERAELFRQLPVHPQRADRAVGLCAGLCLLPADRVLMLYNGCMLGAFLALFISHGLGVRPAAG